MYSLSTCWNSARHTDGHEMLREIRELGFEYAEMSHGIRQGLLPGALDAVKKGVIKISTLHNFCPLPVGINHAAPNVFRFSSPNEKERDRAIRQSLTTIETAAEMKAELIVLHMGDVEMKDHTDRLIELAEEGKQDSPKYQKLFANAIDIREKKKSKYWLNALHVLRILANEAAKVGVKLGIENREAVEEIPFESDFHELLSQFPAEVVGYWHDAGHAQIKENLGFIDHRQHLEAMSERLFGFHIHDVQFPARDHCPPGTGCINFHALRDLVKPEHIKVMEMHPGLKPEHVVEGAEHIWRIWEGR